jgi:2',3'-cyclic-nucleotide 2'-phosphodiesterase (5'-nucleotidase family)
MQFFDYHVFLQLNDVYFLDARADYSKPGGLLLPRIATIVKRLKKELPGKVTVCVPGDFLSPSCLGKLSRGQHMVEIFNCLGVDLVAFGNHEFEQQPLTPVTLAENIAHSKFNWLCGNFEPAAPELEEVFAAANKVKTHEIVRLRDGLVAALFGTTLAGAYGPYGTASRAIEKAGDIIERIRRSEPEIQHGEDEPIFIAMTHQDAADDRAFAKQYPELLLVMGGHDHDEDYVVDQSRPMIVKAASNARTLRFNVLLHRPHKSWQPNLKVLWLNSRSLVLNRVFETTTYAAVEAAPQSVQDLIVPPAEIGRSDYSEAKGFIDDTRLRSGITRFGEFDVGLYSFAIETFQPALIEGIPEDPDARECIDRWERFWDDRSGATREPILVVPVAFNARDGDVRQRSTNVGNLAADALCTDTFGKSVAPIGLLNSGSLRIDRVLPAGEAITERTICDLLFFDNVVHTYSLSGHELWEILRQSFALRSAGGAEGHGDFLQIAGLKAICTELRLARVVTTENDSERDLSDDDMLHVVSTNDYVATISKNYKSYFAGKSAIRRVGSYQTMFESALRRLDKKSVNKAFAKIGAERWISSEVRTVQ